MKFYIITDASSKDYVNTISEKQEFNIQLSKSLENIPENNLQKIFLLKMELKEMEFLDFKMKFSPILLNNPIILH